MPKNAATTAPISTGIEKLPPAVRDALSNYANAQFDAGDWRSDNDESFEDHNLKIKESESALVDAILAAIKGAAPAVAQ